MLRSLQIVLLLAAAPMLTPLPAVAQTRPMTGYSALGEGLPRPDGIVLIGGMNGGMTAGGMSSMTAGGMSGMTAGGMNGGMTAGAMTGGGMNGGMTGGMGGGTAGAGVGGIGGGQPGYSGSPAGGAGQSYGGDPTSGSLQPAQNYQCVTQRGHCSVAATSGSLRHGASCTCLLGGPGKIK